MCHRKMKRFEKNSYDENCINVVSYTCNEVKKLKNEWLNNFKKINSTDAIIKRLGKDKRFEEYKLEIEQFINECEDNEFK